MTEDLAREIKNEIQVFQHSTDITTFRLTFDYYCVDLFLKYGVYDTNEDLLDKDRGCLYLAYTYVMIQVSSKSVMTSMINKLTSSGAEYLSDLITGFLNVQEYQLEADRIWLWDIFRGKQQFICAAFRHDTQMWSDESEKEYSLLYLGAIDTGLQAYLEDYPCPEPSEGSDNFGK